jgi:hypothetical protein
MRCRWAIAGVAAGLLACAAFAPMALADQVVSQVGEGAGQTSNPRGLAVDSSEGQPSSGNLYVADRQNNRIDVFDSSGQFARAVGWGVTNGVSALQVCTTTCRAGIAGAGAGQLDRPSGVAVDNDPSSSSFHDVYVLDLRNFRVDKYSPAGAFLLTFGKGVDHTTGGDVCVAGSGDVCGAGTPGTGAGQLSQSGEGSIAVGPAGVVYVADSPEEGSNLFSNRIERFDSSGAFIDQLPIPLTSGRIRENTLAVDSTGNFYVFLISSEGSGLRKFDHDGALLKTFTGIDQVLGVSVDSGDNLFVTGQLDESPGSPSILEFDAASAPVRQFGYGALEADPHGLAPFSSPSGEIYISEELTGSGQGSRVLHLPFEPPGPLVLSQPCDNTFVGNVKATVTCKVNPEGKPTTVHFEYIDQAGFENGGFSNPATEVTPESASIGEDFHLHATPLSLEGLTPETTYHYRIVATNPDGGPFTGPANTFTTKAPFECGETWATEVTGDSARLHGEVNPLGIAATGFFEYVDEASFEANGFADALKAPAVPAEPPLDFGEGEGLESAEVGLTALAPGTTYRYRLSVSDAFTTRTCEAHRLTTVRAGAAGLPDERAYEMVSPALKENAEVGTPQASTGLNDPSAVLIQQGAPSGEAVTFTSFTAFADPKSAPGASQYVARRGADGWMTQNIMPVANGGNPLFPPFRGFTPDLSFGAVAVSAPPLTPEASPDFESLYLQENESGALRTLTPGTPLVAPGGLDYCVAFGGATPDGSRALVLAFGALTPDAPVKSGASLYEFSAAGGLKLVSLLPGEVPAQPSVNNGFGASGVGCGVGSSIVHNAISDDGSRIFWTFVKGTASRLLARVGGVETVQIDAKQGGPDASGEGRYWGASTDGQTVVFTDSRRLVPGANPGDLYRYDFAAPSGSRLSDLTPAPEAADVKGVVGISDDASHIYFTATGVLSGSANAEGETAQSGHDNLYLWESGAPIKFVATLSERDGNDWESEPKHQTARVTPDGSFLAFSSEASLTGYDNTVAHGSECIFGSAELGLGHSRRCQEAFLYDSATGRISCASCNPSGARPIGPTQLPPWSSPFKQPTYLSDGGGRLFFQTLDALDPHDTDNALDVYEFEREGLGSCTAQTPTFSASAAGCLFLISSGTSTDQAYLIDASSDGRDVFFSSRQPLVGQDDDQHYDIYDARVGGGFPAPPPGPEECAGEACRPPAQGPPPAVPPPSATAPSEGNVTEGRGGVKACPKGKHRVRSHGRTRCVKSGKPAHKRRRAGR